MESGEIPSTVSGIHSKMLWVTEQVSRIPKSGYNSFHKYHYVKEDDLTDAVRKLFIQVGIFQSVSVNEVIQNGTLTTITTTHTFTDVDTGQSITVNFAGAGDDKGDKGIYKAMTGDMKYLLLKTFMIPTGEDPEQDTSTDERNNAKQSGAPARTRVAAAASPAASPSTPAKFLGLREGLSAKTGETYFYMAFDIGSGAPFQHVYSRSDLAGFAYAKDALGLTQMDEDATFTPEDPINCYLTLDTSGGYPKLLSIKRV